MFTIGETVGLAEWIIDDACLVPYTSESSGRVVEMWITFHVQKLHRVFGAHTHTHTQHLN